MTKLEEYKKKYWELSEYILSLDKNEKIVFIEYEKMCKKLNEYNFRNVIVLALLRHLLKKELIHKEQIPEILIIIENETLRKYNEIKDFIKGIDEDGNVILLPKIDFAKRIYEMEDGFLPKYFIFKEILEYNFISKKYLEEQWNNKDTLELFIKQRYETLSKHEYDRWENSIVKYARSNDVPIAKRIDFISELLTDLKRTERNGHSGLQSTIRWLEPLLRELENKQKSISSMSDGRNEPEPENPYPFIFKNWQCWHLFLSWKENASDIKADLNFIFWQMKIDGFMNDITPKQYLDWLWKELKIDFDGYWKQLHRLAPEKRRKKYNIAKHRFNLH